MTTRSRAAVAVLLAALLPACGLQAKKDRTALLARASDVTLALPPHDAVLRSWVRPHDVDGRRLRRVDVGGRSVPVPALELPPAAVALDLRARRAVVTPSPAAAGALGSTAASGLPEGAAPSTSTDGAVPGGEGRGTAGVTSSLRLVAAGLRRTPLAVAFSRWDVFVRPNAGALAEGGGVQAGAGAWLWLDVDALDPDRDTSLAAPSPVLLLAPHVLVLLLDGALTGSVRSLGREDVGGVATSHLRFNADRDKAADGLSDRDARRLERLFEAADVDDPFLEGAEAWVDDAGVARRLSITVEQRVDAATSFDLTYVLELGAARHDPLPLPTNDDLAEVPTMPELLPGATS